MPQYPSGEIFLQTADSEELYKLTSTTKPKRGDYVCIEEKDGRLIEGFISGKHVLTNSRKIKREEVQILGVLEKVHKYRLYLD